MTRGLVLGTITEIAKILAEDIDFKNHTFPACDFATVALSEKEKAEMSLEDIYYNAEGWYGIHQINSGFGFENFCSDGIEVVANYWGGGSGFLVELYDGCSPESDIALAIRRTLERDWSYDSETLLIAEIKDGEGELK